MVANVLQPILYFQKQFSNLSSNRKKSHVILPQPHRNGHRHPPHICMYTMKTEQIGIELGKMECNHLGQFKQYVLNCRANFVKYPLKRTEVCATHTNKIQFQRLFKMNIIYVHVQ